jgi:hypothetical protein
MPVQDQRSLTDRRRRHRGGRRDNDVFGLTPLVLVIGGAKPAAAASEAVLAKLRFGVATSDTADEALAVIATLRPDVVVVSPEDLSRVRSEVPEQLAVVAMRDDPESVVEDIRRSLK